MTSPFWINKHFHIRFKPTYQLLKYAFDMYVKIQNAVIKNNFQSSQTLLKNWHKKHHLAVQSTLDMSVTYAYL